MLVRIVFTGWADNPYPGPNPTLAAENRFTGWADVELSNRGREEVNVRLRARARAKVGGG